MTGSRYASVKLSSVTTKVTSGGTPSRSVPDYFVTTGDGHFWIKSKELLDRSIWVTEEKISDQGLQNSSAKYVPADSVLVAMYGANVGQLGYLRVRATVNQAVCVLIVDDRTADARFVFYAMLNERPKLIVKARGAAQQNLNAETIRDFEIPLPRLDIQRRIAGILSVYDDLIETNTRRIAILEDMARRLFDEWFVKFHFPGRVAGRVLSDWSLPPDWVVSTLGEFFSLHGGEIRTGPFGSQLHRSDYQLNGTPVIMPTNLIGGRIQTAGIARITSPNCDRLDVHKVLPGDIVYGRRGDIGRSALIGNGEAGWICGTGCLRLRTAAQHLDPHYLFHFLGRDDVRASIAGRAIGVTMPNLNTRILEETKLIVPPVHCNKALPNLQVPVTCWSVLC